MNSIQAQDLRQAMVQNANLRLILNANPNLTLNAFEQQKREGLRPTPLTLAWHVVAVKTGRTLAPPPRRINL